MTVPGSSPRMRGTLDNHHVNVEHGGIIPAYAGNTVVCERLAAAAWDHPRVCGEHRTAVAERVENQGSSPRMRGTHAARVLPGHRPGIIPAYAGNTYVYPRNPLRRGDHPRVCGEHKGQAAIGPSPMGSSPRMRGTRAVRFRPSSRLGIIPAYAGNTSWPESKLTLLRDHPRVCGEHINRTSHDLRDRGSSPRMRGTPVRRHVERHRREGIIPAYAGNTR